AAGDAGVPRRMLAGGAAAAAHVARADLAVVGAGGVGRAEGVGRTGRPRTGAGLSDVALAGGRSAHLRARGEGVARAVVRDAVARLRNVTGTGGRAAHGGALRVRGTGGARAGAHLGDIAHAGTRPARESRRLEGVARAARRDPVAHLRHVARTGCRAA